MAYLNPNEAFENFRNRTLEGIQAHFPLKGKQQTLEIEKLEVDDKLHPDDLRAQHEAKNNGESYSVPVHAHLVLKNTQTGEVIDRKRMKIAEIPKMTQRYSYIVDGQEYQVDNQWQLKPGAYVRRRKSGELETRFNVKNGQSFDITLDDKSKQFFAEYKKAKVPLYPLMKTMGVDDDTLERTWGKEIFNASKNARGVDGAMQRMYKTMTKQEAPSKDHAVEHIYKSMLKSEMRPDSTEYTLGKPLSNVNGDALTLATQKMLHVHQGKAAVDDRDSIIFKDLRSAGDYAHDKITASIVGVRTKASRKLGSAKKIGEIVNFDMFNEPIKQSFHKNSAARTATQINPLEMASSAMQTTLTGSGGIQSDRAITDEAKFIDPSHLGYLDPINTPEGCFDSETQVFTRAGWLFWDAVDMQTEFACMVDGRLEFHKPLELQKYEYVGLMYGVKKPWLEYLVTPNHRVLCRPYDAPRKSSYRVVRADQVHGKPRLFPITHAASSGADKEFFELPLVEGNNSSVNVEHVDMHDWAELMGWFLSEGSYTYDEGTSSYQVKIFQSYTVNRENCDRIESLFNRLPWEWCITERDNGRLVYTIGVKQLASYMSQFGRCDEKYIPEYFFDLSPSIRTTLLEALLAGDGRLCATHKNKRQSSQYYTTTSKRLSHDVERLVISLGKAATWHKYSDKRKDEYLDTYEVCILRDKERSALPGKGHYYTQDYKGMVYCATVPGSFLYVRRNYKHPLWMGNSKTGVSLRLPMGVKKVGNTPMIRLHNMKTGQMEDVPPAKFMSSNVLLADQVEWKDGKPHPKFEGPLKMAGPNNDIHEKRFEEAHYAMKHPSQMFNMTSNLVPFMHSTQGNRAGMAARHMEQSISLMHREAPLVQVATGVEHPSANTFEKVMGYQASHTSPFAGTVTSITPGGITIKHADGDHEVQTYHNYPLNDAKSVLHSEPLVKVGDKVKAGQVIADTNYSKNGTLALGTNLRVAYVPFKGYNFEDGVVISESAAKKLSSVHMYKPSLPVKNMVFDKKKFMNQHMGTFKSSQLEHIGDDGLPKVGAKIKPGDPILLAMKPFDAKDRMGISAIRKSLSGMHSDKSMVWDGETEGEVVNVVKKKDTVEVHVRAVEPMQVGDKMAGRYGNKGICFDPETEVLTDRGWRYFYELDGDELICTLGADRRIEYQKPTDYVSFQHDGLMYRFTGRRLDLMTTPNHNLYVRTPKSKEYRLEPAESCIGSVRVHLKTGKWTGVRQDTFTVPGRPRREGSKDRYEFCDSRSYDMDDFLEFFGYYLSEGCCSASHINIGQSRKENPDVHQDIEHVLRRLGYDPYVHENGFSISDPRLSYWLSSFGLSLEKFIPREFLALDTDQLHILVGALFAGDGGVYFRKKDNHTRRELFTSSKQLADDYQELALRLGFCAHIKSQVRKDRRNVEYVVRWSSKGEAYTQEDSRYESRTEKMVDYSGPVYCVQVPNHVIYIRRNGIPVWCGNCTTILPDSQMPHTKDGKHMEVLLNPSGVPGRINPAQLLEVAASKIADKTGKPFLVSNFDNKDWNTHIQDELKKHNLSATDELIDPSTGKSIGHVTTGKQHIIKLVHQVDKKVHVTPGMGLVGVQSHDSYDLNLQPHNGQRIGALGLYAMLAHGAKANIREMQTWKSEGEDPQELESKRWKSQHVDVWKAIQTGEPLPPPKPTFAFKKFEEMLKATGVSLDKKGHELILTPLTHKDIVALAPTALKDPGARLEAKVDKKTGDLKTEKGGLFCDEATGGHGGRKWSRIDLAEPMPNPIFEAPIKALTGIKQSDFDDLVAGRKALNTQGEIVGMKPGLLTGGAAIEHMLKKIDPKRDLAQAKEQLNKVPLSQVDAALKKVKYLQALDNLGMKANDAYILKAVPVLPPAMRPASPLPDGSIKYADLNHLYMDFGLNNAKLGDKNWVSNMPHEDVAAHREATYDGIKAIMGAGVPYKDQKHKGLLHQIAGPNPKKGFFQNTLINKRQDLTMRSTIVPEPNLGLDEVGLPTDHALTLFRPFVVKKLQDMGVSRSPHEAQKEIAKKSTASIQALDKVMVERPVLLKRDPVLHKYGIQGFQPKRVEGSAIKIHPLVCGGYNADFDGDSIDLDTPIPLRIQGEVALKTGRELVELLGAGQGNYIALTEQIEAYTYNGWRPVKSVSFHTVTDKKKFRVTLRNGHSFIASEDHSLMVGREKVKPADLVLGTELDHVNVQEAGEGDWSYEKGVVYGNFLGDGCAEIRSVGGGRVAIACKPQTEREYLMDLWRREFHGANPSQYVWGFHVNGVDLARHFLQVCGRYCEGKYVSSTLLNKGQEFLKGLLAGYILSDGSVEMTRSGSFLVRTWSRSKQLRDGMSLVASLIGLPHAIRERTAKGKVNYIISFGKEAIKLLDYRCPGKKGGLLGVARQEYCDLRKDARASLSGRGFEVCCVEEVTYDDRMIDLEVDDDSHVFVLLGGIVVHNTMSVFVPISREAVAEAHNMKPTNNLFAESSGKPVYVPSHEGILGNYKLSMVGADTKKEFSNPGQVLDAAQKGHIKHDDVVHLGGKPTTAGRVLLATALPQPMQESMMHDLDRRLDAKGINNLLAQVGKEHKNAYDSTVNKLKDLGNNASYGLVPIPLPTNGINNITDPKKVMYVSVGAHTLSVKDFAPDRDLRNKHLSVADELVAKDKANKNLTQNERDARLVGHYMAADKKMKEEHFASEDERKNNLLLMANSGIKPGWAQYKQLRLAPLLYQDAAGKVIPMPVKKTFSEGVDLADYWTHMHGARRGTVMRTQETRDPGYMSKLIMNTMMDTQVTGHDCGTTKGISMHVDEKDIHDRVLAHDFKAGKVHIKSGTIITPDIIGQVRSVDKDAKLVVRSPLKCEHGKGICQKCAGLGSSGDFHPEGTNIGVIATQTLGERATQLPMKEFHTGGTAGGGSSLVNSFTRLEQLMTLPKKVPNAATIAMSSGTIQKIEHTPLGTDIWVNGKRHHVGTDNAGNPLHIPLPGVNPVDKGWVVPKVGMKVEAGQHLSDPSRTVINMHDFYDATKSIDKVQNQMTNDIYNLYKDEGIKRRHVETIVKSMSGHTKILDAGDSDHGILRGEFHPLSQVQKINSDLIRAGKRPIEHKPALKGVNMLPLVVQEDWMAKMQHERIPATIQQAAAMNQKSSIHGPHPIPAAAYAAEFGMTEEKSKLPGLGHLSNVPKHHY